MPKVTRRKIGFVLIRFLPERKQWRASFRDQDGRYVRRLLWTSDYAEAVTIAEQINRRLLQGRGYLPSARRTDNHSVRETLEESIRHSGGNEKTKRDYVYFGNYFLAWLKNTHSGIQNWYQLLPAHVREYQLYCQRKGYAYDTIRQRLYVVRMAAKYMSSNYPERYRLITLDLKLKRDRKQAVRYLTHKQLEGYLGFLCERYPDIYPITMLQGLAGLRILEAINLRRQDVDFASSTITITETPKHKPKTLSSYRQIPIAGRVVEAIQATLEWRKIVPIEGYIFTNPKGELWSTDWICRKIKRSLREYAAMLRNPAVADLRPHELRATFVTMMCSFGVSDRILKRYIGHTIDDIMGKHYEGTSLENLRVVVRELEKRWNDKNEPSLHSNYIERQAVHAGRWD